ncbi:MAG: hypothetical protein P1U74_08360 [Legionellaceae bacterium]|nr:hypothetical protein [Legionellaceae bacterium]
MNPVISLLLPSRGRAALVERLFDSIVATTRNLDQIELILYLDDDDIGSHHLDSQNIAVTKVIGSQPSMGGYNSACLALAKGSIIILINDDVVIRTVGWDEQVIEMDAKFEDKVYLAYANDLFKKNWCSFPILSRKTCEELIEPYPADYKGAFIDTHLYDVFKRVQKAGFDRICYLEKVVFEHLHYRTGKATFDDTYKKRGRFSDDAAFVQLATTRQSGANRLISIIKGEELSPQTDRSERPEYTPRGLFSATKYLSKQFLFDKKLPFRWRFFLWYWFIGRYMAAEGLLWPLVKA